MLHYFLIGFFILLIAYCFYNSFTMLEGYDNSIPTIYYLKTTPAKAVLNKTNYTIQLYDAAGKATKLFTGNSTVAAPVGRYNTNCSTIYDCTTCVQSTDKSGTTPPNFCGWSNSTAKCGSIKDEKSITSVEKCSGGGGGSSNTDIMTMTFYASDKSKATLQLSFHEYVIKVNDAESGQLSTYYSGINDGNMPEVLAEGDIVIGGPGKNNNQNNQNSNNNNSNYSNQNSNYANENYNQKYSSNANAIYDHYTKDNYAQTYYGPNGSTVRIIHVGDTYSIIETDPNGNTNTFTLQSNHPDESFSEISHNTFYSNVTGASATVTNINGTYTIKITSSDGKVTVYSEEIPQVTTSSPLFDDTTMPPQASALPPGIPKAMIPFGQNDLYILKTQIVPPVCPMCPNCYRPNKKNKKTSSKSKGKSGSSECPACETCNQSNFQYMPDFNAGQTESSSKTDPMPYLNTFASFK
jgi:hypothetical protein